MTQAGRVTSGGELRAGAQYDLVKQLDVWGLGAEAVQQVRWEVTWMVAIVPEPVI